MAFETNRFCWQGCISTDTDAAKAFYTEVLGWKAMTMPMGDATATMFTASDVPFAHLAEPMMAGVPSHWNNYLRVDDVDKSAAEAAKNGGKIVVPSTDIPPGRFSIVSSPSGATFTLFHEANPAESSHHPGGAGSVHWVELHSTNLAGDLAWLKSTFGFEAEKMDMPDNEYFILNSGGEPRGGATNGQPGVPAMWLTWINVTDLDATVGRAASNGGKTLMPPMEIPNIGRMAMIQDPAGGVLGVITPAA